ncbi:hypothetical protein GOQ30_12780 [Flavobacterium sp. TP390]|uniref:Uncharacterized protein n=1 Tax=Flavobacterium profundi TaxID=1774945 RepID=A0A6I4IT44_9FLAO|nr:hypothetical protein [Flavobacterium profundi]MVO10039.1 hypothetical protein [Flavobacterium profundi]
MKKSILNLEGLQTLSKKQQVNIQGAHNGTPHPDICGKPGYPPCVEK